MAMSQAKTKMIDSLTEHLREKGIGLTRSGGSLTLVVKEPLDHLPAIADALHDLQALKSFLERDGQVVPAPVTAEPLRAWPEVPDEDPPMDPAEE